VDGYRPPEGHHRSGVVCRTKTNEYTACGRKTRQDKDKTRQDKDKDKARQGKARQGKARLDKTRQDKTRQRQRINGVWGYMVS
jgi:hypothetical protein